MTSPDDPGPALTPAEAATLHDQPEGVSFAWFAVPAPDGAGTIARVHTEAYDGGQLPPRLVFDPVPVAVSPPGSLEW